MKTHIARSIFDTQARLEQAVTVDDQTRAQGTPWISAHFRDTLVASLAQLRASSAEHGQVREAFLRVQKQRRSEVDQLARLVRDFFQVLRRRSNRLDQRDAVEALYKRPTRVPQWASVPEWLQWAKNIIQGELQAQAMGYPAMANPSADEVAEVLARASASEVLWSERFQQLKAHEQRLREARVQGTRTLRGLAMRLRETLAHEVPATRRELMRTFGFSFISTGAKDRQKAASSSQLNLLIKPALPGAQDADPEPGAEAVIESPSPFETPVIDRPANPPAPALSALATVATQTTQAAPVPQASAPTADKAAPHDAAQSRDAQGSAIEPKTVNPNSSRQKLSRRQKKALRRAQVEAQNAAQTTRPSPVVAVKASPRLCA